MYLLLHRFLFIASVPLLIMACNGGDEPEPVEEEPIKTEEISYCENTCVFANDGECDDGGPGSSWNYCNLGTDCDDCGTRTVITVKD